MERNLQSIYDQTSYAVHDLPDAERHGFAKGLTLRRHKNEAEANNSVYQMRQDWLRLIGPVETFGNCNPYHGNAIALILPFTKPERVAVSSYFFECKNPSNFTLTASSESIERKLIYYRCIPLR